LVAVFALGEGANVDGCRKKGNANESSANPCEHRFVIDARRNIYVRYNTSYSMLPEK
jgi:hypothetical protein